MAGRVIDLRAHHRYAPDLVSLVCSQVRDTRSRTGLSVREFAAALEPLLGWLPKPGFIQSWESDVEPPSTVVQACALLLARNDPAASGSAESADAYLEDASSAICERDEIVVPCRALDGRTIWVSIPRRAFLTGGLGAAALTAIAAAAEPGPSGAAMAKIRAVANEPAGMTPIEHLRQLRGVLVESDNLLGSDCVMPAVHSQIQLINQLRNGRSGSDRRALLVIQAEYAEFAGWLHQDARDFTGARYWLDRASEWSQMAADQDLATYVMARKSQLAGDMHEGGDAVDLADAAGSMARQGSRLQATAATYGAHGHALAGQATACMRTIDGAREMAERLDGDSASPWASWLDSSYIEVQRGRCLSALGQHDQAAAVFRQAIRELPESFRRDRGVYLARESLAHARARDPEQAADVGMKAIAIAHDTQSGRVINELTQVGAGLAPWASVPAVANFQDALTTVIPAERTG
jgi:tetratricopeptide (TPR) repeat protein